MDPPTTSFTTLSNKKQKNIYIHKRNLSALPEKYSRDTQIVVNELLLTDEYYPILFLDFSEFLSYKFYKN